MKRTKARRDIKSKLIAAICMLMVSVIMLASTSYAWFTLSTAPEVKGIQTSVGANGNLEIALLSTDGSYENPMNISSVVGDSSAVVGVVKANATWGNLVDLSHESYGLSLITLKPAQLMMENNAISGEQILAVPLYGADGRVTTLDNTSTIMATFNNAKKAFMKPDTTAEGYDATKAVNYGVRAIGSSTSRSAREMMFDTYMSKGALSASQAKTAAANSLNAYGQILANIGIKGAEGTGEFTTADLAQLQQMLNSITGYDVTVEETTTHTNGVMDYVKDALTNYSIAVLASDLNPNTYATDADFTAAMTELASKSMLQIAEAIEAYAPQALKDAAKAYAEVNVIINGGDLNGQTVAGARTTLNNLIGSGQTSYTWAEISTVIGALFDSSKMTFCGMTIAEVKDPGDPDDPTTSGLVKLQEKMQDKYNGQLVVEMAGGIYSEIADLTDTFSGSAYLTVQGMTAKSVMQAMKTSNAKALLGQVNAAIAAAPAPKGTSTVVSISDPYAYIVDLAFRTNASNSKLLLQTAAEQRIDTSSDENTQGAGSNMTFTSVDGFATADMIDLMKNIKIIFFENNGDAKTILAEAKLDTANATVTGNDVTADLKIVKGEGLATQAEAVITSLPTNQAKKISVLVYLDGTSITNADVGTGALSMSGRMNLQFSSSANLVPMDYSAGYAAAVEPAEENAPATGN